MVNSNENLNTTIFWTGIATLGFIFIGNIIVRRCGWFWGVVLTPLMFLLVGSAFFTFVLIEGKLSYILPGLTAFTPLVIIVSICG